VAVQEILVLIVEDDALIQMELEQTLQDGGYATVAEVSGEEAIAKLESEPNIRALISDINLSKRTSGWDVARRARELFPDLPARQVRLRFVSSRAKHDAPLFEVASNRTLCIRRIKGSIAQPEGK
jgi:CheY-like chemotaxis protein